MLASMGNFDCRMVASASSWTSSIGAGSGFMREILSAFAPFGRLRRTSPPAFAPFGRYGAAGCVRGFEPPAPRTPRTREPANPRTPEPANPRTREPAAPSSLLIRSADALGDPVGAADWNGAPAVPAVRTTIQRVRGADHRQRDVALDRRRLRVRAPGPRRVPAGAFERRVHGGR